MDARFQLESDYRPTGDQPEAIDRLVGALRTRARRLTLEGVTGSGKTFTMANVIARLGRPTLVISHNKTLAAQLFTELKAFFPHNAVEYFVSYYDYYQPEAYIPQTDTYIEKDASINEAIERYRLASTNALLGRRDVIIVASVSCIYGLGSPADYADMLVDVHVGQHIERDAVLAKLVAIQYTRNDFEPQPGVFRVRGDTLDCFPAYAGEGIRIAFFGDEVESIEGFDPVTGRVSDRRERAIISPARHFVMPHDKIMPALARIRSEMQARVRELIAAGKLIEAQRLQQRTAFDLEMLKEMGYCPGIENYARHLSGRPAGSPPDCLIDYFPKGDFLTIVDESHVTLPQIRGMYNGDQARKQTLVEHGFRLPSARDNRPLNFDEFLAKTGALLFASATPGPYERHVSEVFVEQIIRPTGLLDPPVEVRSVPNPLDDLIAEVRNAAARRQRVLVTTLTKRTAEDLTGYLREVGLKVAYLHADIDAIERVETLARLRRGDFDCLIGINLLREGLDLPEVALVAVLDADKEGFLRSATALVQTAGRAARHVEGRVILYAETVTDSMRRMMEMTAERRKRQQAYNREHGLRPRGTTRRYDEGLAGPPGRDVVRGAVAETPEAYDVHQAIQETEREMLAAAEALEYERAAMLRDTLNELHGMQPDPAGTPARKRKQRPGRKGAGFRKRPAPASRNNEWP